MVALAKRASVVGLLAFLTMAAGCPALQESNQQACSRAYTRLLGCLPDANDEPEAISGLVSSLCGEISESEDCDFPALANCVANLSCDEMLGQTECDDLLDPTCMSSQGLPQE